MRQRTYRTGEEGFTLNELLVVVGIIGILSSVAAVTYVVFVKQARAIEAEAALLEIHRLESLYYDAHDAYSSDLQAIGYDLAPSLKHYILGVQVIDGAGGVAYRVTALPHGGPQMEVWVLDRYVDGTTVLKKVPPPAIAASSPGGGPSQGPSSSDGAVPQENSSGNGSGSGTAGTGKKVVIQTINDPGAPASDEIQDPAPPGAAP